MANREACELYIEQEIKEGLEQGKKPYSIGKELYVWVEKFFETKIPARTLEQRARRLSGKDATNVAKKSQPPETIANSTPEIIKDRMPQGGGARENSGRPPKELFICKQCGCEFESIEFAYEIDGGRCSACQQRSPGNNSKYADPNAKSDAIFITSIIISQLERIKINDPKRQEAFEIIIKWIEANSEADDWTQPKSQPVTEAGAEPISNCSVCQFHKGMASSAKGVKIPGAYGKCIRPGGLCGRVNLNSVN